MVTPEISPAERSSYQKDEDPIHMERQGLPESPINTGMEASKALRTHVDSVRSLTVDEEWISIGPT